MSIRSALVVVAAAFTLAAPTVSFAEPYVDYTPEKGVWEINAIEVDPNHVDDYLTGLRRTDTPGFEIMKKHGIIDQYVIMVRQGYSKGSPNVLIGTHFVSVAMLAPDKARDQMIEKEILAGLPEAQGKAAIAGYEKYRQFLDDGYWGEVTMAK